MPSVSRAESVHTDIIPVHMVREKAAKGPKLWLKEPESQIEDRTLIGARLCSCSDVCLAVIEDR